MFGTQQHKRHPKPLERLFLFFQATDLQAVSSIMLRMSFGNSHTFRSLGFISLKISFTTFSVLLAAFTTWSISLWSSWMILFFTWGIREKKDTFPIELLLVSGHTMNRGFHVGDARLGGVRIFDAHVKIQHDAQWSVLTWASIFWRTRHQRENPYCQTYSQNNLWRHVFFPPNPKTTLLATNYNENFVTDIVYCFSLFETNLGRYIHGLLFPPEQVYNLSLICQFDFVQVQWLFGECSRVLISVARNVALAGTGTLWVGFCDKKQSFRIETMRTKVCLRQKHFSDVGSHSIPVNLSKHKYPSSSQGGSSSAKHSNKMTIIFVLFIYVVEVYFNAHFSVCAMRKKSSSP